MSDNRRITNILGAGTLAYDFVPKFLAACAQQGALASINTAGVAEFNRATIAHAHPFSWPGVVNVSPDPQAITAAIGFLGDDGLAERSRRVWEPLTYETIDRAVQAIMQRRLTGSQTLWVQGMRTGHGKPANEMLQRLKEKVPDQHIVAKSVIGEDADQRPKAIIGYDLFQQLHERDVLEVVVLTDNASPFALARKLTIQDDYEARAWASLLAAQGQFAKTKGFGEVGHSLGSRTRSPVGRSPAAPCNRCARGSPARSCAGSRARRRLASTAKPTSTT